MPDRNRIQSIQAAQDYTNRKKRKLLNAKTGNNAGTVETGTGDLWWIRLHSDPNQVVRARSSRELDAVAGLDIVVELVNRTGIPYYQILGRAVGILYPTDPYTNIIIGHHEQHERTDAGEGGTDPIDVFPRMIAVLRAHEQAVPNMTVRVDAGEGAIDATHLLFTGGNSPAFTAPTNFRKFDLLYLGTDNALHIQVGTEVSGWALPTKTPLATPGIPIAWILLSPSTTTITESLIYDAGLLRGFVSAGAGDVTGPAGATADHLASFNGATGKIIKDSGIASADVTLKDGSRAFTNPVGGVAPVASSDLATKEYVDQSINFTAEYYFNNTASSIGGIYYKMLEASTGEGQSNFATAGLGVGNNQALTNFATDAGIPGVDTLQAGIYSAHIHAKRNAGNKPVKIYFAIYTRAVSTAETLHTTSEISGFLPDTETEYDLHAVLATNATIATTDRIIIKWFANVTAGGSDATVTLSAEGTTASHLNVPITTEVLSSVFVRQDGAKPLTANWDAGSFEIRAETLKSDVATGTAPLTIASTTAVTNLNADLLDGFHAASLGVPLEVKEADGAPDVTPVTQIIVTNGKLTDNGGGSVSLDLSASGSALEVKEADGAPDVNNVSQIIVTNGKLTDNGGGSVSLDLSGGGGGAPDSADYWVETANAGLSAEVVVGTTGITRTVYGSRPAAAKAGRISLPSNSFIWGRDNGATFDEYALGFPLPGDVSLAPTTWVNQGSATVSTTNGGIYLSDPANNAISYRIRKKAVPSNPTVTPYTITTVMFFNGAQPNYSSFGIGWRQSSDGKLHLVRYLCQSATELDSLKCSSETADVSNYTNVAIRNPASLVWLRIAEDATNRTIYFSFDGINFIQFHQIGRTDYLTADEVLFFVSSRNANWECGVWLLSWVQA